MPVPDVAGETFRHITCDKLAQATVSVPAMPSDSRVHQFRGRVASAGFYEQKSDRFAAAVLPILRMRHSVPMMVCRLPIRRTVTLGGTFAMNVPIVHHHASLSQVTMHYVTAGAGEVAVLLHGWPQTWYEWRHVIPHVVEAGYRVVAPDLRGLGDTSRPAAGYDSGSVAGDIAELLADHLGVTRFHLAGHDWGGPTAFALAAANPRAVETLAVVDVTIPGLGPDMSQGGRRWHHTFHRTPDLPEALTEGRERIYLGWFYEEFSYRSDAVGPADVEEYLRSYGQPGALGVSFGYYRNIPVNVAANLALADSGFRLKMPVLAVGGGRTEARGRAEEPELSLRTIADDVSGVVIADSGHFVPEEAPAELAATMIAHFGRRPIGE